MSVLTFKRASRGGNTELEVFGGRSSNVPTHDPDDLISVVRVGERHGVAGVGLEANKVHLKEQKREERWRRDERSRGSGH